MTSREAKIGDNGSGAFIMPSNQHHVFAFEIAMDNAGVMGRFECVGKLLGYGPSLGQGQSATGQTGPQSLPMKQFHGDKGDFSATGRRRPVLVEIVDAANVRMGDLFSGVDLPDEPDPYVVPIHNVGSNSLQCDRFAEHAVFRLVDFAHTTHAEEADNTEAVAQYLARPERCLRNAQRTVKKTLDLGTHLDG